MWIKLPWDADGTVSQWSPVVGVSHYLLSSGYCIHSAIDILPPVMQYADTRLEKRHIPEGFTFADDAQGVQLARADHSCFCCHCSAAVNCLFRVHVARAQAF